MKRRLVIAAFSLFCALSPATAKDRLIGAAFSIEGCGEIVSDPDGQRPDAKLCDVQLTLTNRADEDLLWKIGILRWQSAGRTGRLRISYNRDTLHAGDQHQISIQCVLLAPSFIGQWDAYGVAENIGTGETINWQISGACP